MDQKQYDDLIQKGRSDAAKGLVPDPHIPSGTPRQVYDDARAGRK